MSRHRYVWRNGQMVELDLNAPPRRSVAPYVMSDIREYPSIITGEVIGSRSTHREHLRMHGCIELGNDMPSQAREALPPVVDDVIAAIEASPETHAEARAMMERNTDAMCDSVLGVPLPSPIPYAE